MIPPTHHLCRAHDLTITQTNNVALLNVLAGMQTSCAHDIPVAHGRNSSAAQRCMLRGRILIFLSFTQIWTLRPHQWTHVVVPASSAKRTSCRNPGTFLPATLPCLFRFLSACRLTKYIHLFPRLLNTLAVFTICLLVFAVSAGASAIARGKKPRSVQRRKLLAKRQRLRLMAIRSVTEMGTRHWNALSDQISWLSETIWHLRNQQCHRGKSRRSKRQASAHFLSRQHRAASSASGNSFTNILAFSSSLARRSSPRRWVLVSFYN